MNAGTRLHVDGDDARSFEGKRMVGSRPASVTQPEEEAPNPGLRFRGNHVIRKSGKKLVSDTVCDRPVRR